MSAIMYTKGGSPVFLPSSSVRSAARIGKNPRFLCQSGCGAKTTKNQLLKNHGYCHQCSSELKPPELIHKLIAKAEAKQ